MEKTARATMDKAYAPVAEKVRKLVAGATDLTVVKAKFKEMCIAADVPTTSDRHNFMHLAKDLARKSNFATGDSMLEDVFKLLKGNGPGRGLEKNGGKHHVLAMYEAGMKVFHPKAKKAPKAKKVKEVKAEVSEAVNI